MSLKHLLLLSVGEDVAAAFARQCERAGAYCSAYAQHSVPASPTQPVALCIVGSLRDPHAVREFRSIRKMLRGCPIVVLAEGLSTDVVVQLIRSGATDVIGLPLSAEVAVARAWVSLDKEAEEAGDLVGTSAVFRELLSEVRAVAAVRSTVLLSGETGTGKGIIARTIHRLSDRSDRRFVHVDCSSLAESVIESELFGHQKGSFTGAVESRPGRFEVAGDGTIFLDEIGELSPALQVKLLRILEDREFERVGSSRTQPMKARVIAATNRDLRRLVEQRRFRADLYFRLDVFQLRVPPLRDRRDDIPPLVHMALARIAERLELPVPAVTDGFLAGLMQHAWPGNVRELMNAIERILIRDHGPVLGAEALAGLAWAEPDPSDEKAGSREVLGAGSLDVELNRETVAEVLLEVGGNLSRAARRLGIARSTLRYRIRQLGLEALIPRD